MVSQTKAMFGSGANLIAIAKPTQATNTNISFGTTCNHLACAR